MLMEHPFDNSYVRLSTAFIYLRSHRTGICSDTDENALPNRRSRKDLEVIRRTHCPRNDSEAAFIPFGPQKVWTYPVPRHSV
jgi:hypothetical protein